MSHEYSDTLHFSTTFSKTRGTDRGKWSIEWVSEREELNVQTCLFGLTLPWYSDVILMPAILCSPSPLLHPHTALREWLLSKYTHTHSHTLIHTHTETNSLKPEHYSRIILVSLGFISKSLGIEQKRISDVWGGWIYLNLSFLLSLFQCPPCRSLTRVLVESYRTVKESGQKFEIVFVSADR